MRGLIDTSTGREVGDHGTAQQAIDFCLSQVGPGIETETFLKCWNEGSLDEWPEFYEFLRCDEEASEQATTTAQHEEGGA